MVRRILAWVLATVAVAALAAGRLLDSTDRRDGGAAPTASARRGVGDAPLR